MRGLSVGGGLVAVAEVLGQVLGEVADAPAGVSGSGEDALSVEPGAEPGHVPRLVLVADGVEGLVPSRQHLARVWVKVGTGVLIPGRQVPAVVLDVRDGPPDLVVGGGDDLAELGPGDGAADGEVDVRGEPPLGFDGGEVLQVIADIAAQVLDEPVEQRGEMQRVARNFGERDPVWPTTKVWLKSFALTLLPTEGQTPIKMAAMDYRCPLTRASEPRMRCGGLVGSSGSQTQRCRNCRCSTRLSPRSCCLTRWQADLVRRRAADDSAIRVWLSAEWTVLSRSDMP
jgi:hypothetical protein